MTALHWNSNLHWKCITPIIPSRCRHKRLISSLENNWASIHYEFTVAASKYDLTDLTNSWLSLPLVVTIGNSQLVMDKMAATTEWMPTVMQRCSRRFLLNKPVIHGKYANPSLRMTSIPQWGVCCIQLHWSTARTRLLHTTVLKLEWITSMNQAWGPESKNSIPAPLTISAL